MKKTLLTMFAAAFATCSFAQSVDAGDGAWDDFSTQEPIANADGSVGIYWFTNDDQTSPDATITRDSVNSRMQVACNNCGGTDDGFQSLIGVGFGDDNGSDHYLDLSADADIEIEIENTSTTDSVYITIQLEDLDGNKGEFEPYIADVGANTWGTARKGKISLLLAPSETGTYTIDLTSITGAIGGLALDIDADSRKDDIPTPDNLGWECGGTDECPHTTHALDPSTVSKVLFFFEPGPGAEATFADYTNLNSTTGYPTDEINAIPTAFTGTINFKSFKIGTGSIDGATTGPTVTTGISDEAFANSISVSPNPTSDVATISVDADEYVLTNSLGTAVATGSGSTIDVSGLPTGVYVATIVKGSKVATKKIAVN